MMSQNSSAAETNNRKAIDYNLFKNLKSRTLMEAARSNTPPLRELREEDQMAFVCIALERLCYAVGFKLDAEQTAIVIDFATTTYVDWRLADWKVFYLRCCEGRYGKLEAYDRQNPQLLLTWMREYEGVRKEAEETARLYGGG